MSGYGYAYRSSSAFNPAQADDWTRASYTVEHAYRPVIVDSEGRKRPVVSFGPAQYVDRYGDRTDSTFQRARSPPGSERKYVGHNSAPYSPEDYGSGQNKWPKPYSSDYDRPKEVDNFISNVQTEASRPRYPSSTSSWNPTVGKSTGFNGSTGGYHDPDDFSNKNWTKPVSSGDYKEHNDSNNRDWLKTSGNTYRNDNYDDYYRKPTSPSETGMNTTGGWVRPTRETWSSPPGSLSGATNDIGTAIGYLVEATKPSGPYPSHSSYAEPDYQRSNDIRETEKRYGRYNFSSRPFGNRI